MRISKRFTDYDDCSLYNCYESNVIRIAPKNTSSKPARQLSPKFSPREKARLALFGRCRVAAETFNSPCSALGSELPLRRCLMRSIECDEKSLAEVTMAIKLSGLDQHLKVVRGPVAELVNEQEQIRKAMTEYIEGQRGKMLKLEEAVRKSLKNLKWGIPGKRREG